MEKDTQYITLGQFLKVADYVNSGGEAKHLIRTFDITVNGIDEHRRGRKLYPGDIIVINGDKHEIAENDES